MVRATAAEVVKKFGGAYPPGWDATSVGNICTQADAEIDGRASPSTFGTGTNHVEFVNELVYRKIVHSNWASAGGALSGAPEPVVWTKEFIQWFHNLLTDTTYDSVTYVKLQET